MIYANLRSSDSRLLKEVGNLTLKTNHKFCIASVSTSLRENHKNKSPAGRPRSAWANEKIQNTAGDLFTGKCLNRHQPNLNMCYPQPRDVAVLRLYSLFRRCLIVFRALIQRFCS